eukprot:11209084-Lingulodinium_polyedra.AAC.1
MSFNKTTSQQVSAVHSLHRAGACARGARRLARPTMSSTTTTKGAGPSLQEVRSSRAGFVFIVIARGMRATLG